jgi:N-acetylated-alpha-linked acidic dipeptidase
MVVPAQDRILNAIATDVPWELVETFSRHPRWKPEDVNHAAQMLVARLEALHVPVTVHEPEIYLSIPFHAEVRAGGVTFRAKPPAMARDCRGGVTAPLAYVPAQYSKSIGTLFNKNQDADASSEARIRGRIVISEGFAFPGKMLEFERKGAVGVIAINPGADAHWGICTSIWGTPDLDDLPRKPAIPVAAVSNPDGQKLIALAASGGEATIVTHMEEGWYRQKVPVVTIPGTEEPEKFVLLHGHYDSWDVGVGDNATGDATMLELARVFWHNRDVLKRSVKIAWWPGHSTGRYAGSTWFADAFALDLDENCIAQVNCDSPGCRWATTFKDLSLTSETEAHVARSVHQVCGLAIEAERPHRAGDYSFNNIGISSFLMLSSTMSDADRAAKGYYAVGGCGGNIAWHTEHDLMEIADRDNLLRDIRVYAAAVLGVVNADLLPFDWCATMREFRGTLERYQKAAGDAFDLGPAAVEVDLLDAALGRLHDGVAAGRVAAGAANSIILRLARILIPLNYSKEARFRHDPALPVAPLPMVAAAVDVASMPPGQRGFALTTLLRGRNRIVADLRAARQLVEGVL